MIKYIIIYVLGMGFIKREGNNKLKLLKDSIYLRQLIEEENKKSIDINEYNENRIKLNSIKEEIDFVSRLQNILNTKIKKINKDIFLTYDDIIGKDNLFNYIAIKSNDGKGTDIEILNEDKTLENNNINNKEIDSDIEKKERLDFDDEIDNDNSFNNNFIVINGENNRQENNGSEFIEDREILEFNNDLYELNNNNMSLLDRLLLKDDIKKELKNVIVNIKNHKSNKRFKVSGESDDERDMKNLYEKTGKVKLRYPKK